MTNYFLEVNKDFFNLGLNPTEILVLAQIAEYNRTTKNCFISDKTLAQQFGVSDRTISRAIGKLEQEGFIKRETKNVKGGKERHLFIQLDQIEEKLTKDKMTVDGETQPTKCPLTNDSLSLDNRQNDLIKEKGKDKEKDNSSEPIQPTVEVVSNQSQKVRTVADQVKGSTNADGAFSF